MAEGEEGKSKPSVVDKAQDIKKKADDIKKIKDMAEKAKMIKNVSMLGPLATVLLYALVVILIIIVVVGIVMFLATMPGLILGKLKALADTFFTWCLGKLEGHESVVDMVEVAETADYIESMGYDLKGYGFVTEDAEKKDEVDRRVGDIKTKQETELDKNMGVLRFTEDKVVAEITSRPILYYLRSNNYVYTLRNENVSFKSAWERASWWEKILDIAFPWKILGEVLFGKDADKGTGLIGVYDDKGTIGNKGDVDFTTSLEIDMDAKTLSITRGWFTNKSKAFNLDGWTGRYGIPLEFLLSVHLATMAPDLAIEMAKSFETEVVVLLHKVDNSEVMGAYKPDGGDYITFEDIEIAVYGDKSDNTWDSVKKFFKDLFTDEMKGKEKILFELGVEHSTNCECCQHVAGNKGNFDCEKSEEDCEGVVCADCKAYLQALKGALEEMTSYHFDTYTPYISKVKDHWFRDVYFVASANEQVIVTDTEYERETKERWSLYEVYTKDSSIASQKGYRLTPAGREDLDGEYVLLYEASGEYTDEKGNKKTYTKGNEFLPDSEYAKEVGRSQYAKELGIPVEKNVITDSISEIRNNVKNGEWKAYENAAEKEGGWEQVEVNDDSPSSIKEFEGKDKLYIKETIKAGDIEQTEDGVRKATNSSIKRMFLEDKYFIYDGTVKKADMIMKVKEGKSGGKASDFEKKTTDEKQKIIQEIEKETYVFKKETDTDGIEKIVSIVDTTENSDVEEKYTKDTEQYEVVEGINLVGKISLSKDSLSAFSMLENMNSLDADYIYRDFKELIVELDYFDKEDLTESKTDVFEWILPDTGSAGWPVRKFDKNENYYGSLIHSKEDYDIKTGVAMKEAAAIISEIPEEIPEDVVIEESNNNPSESSNTVATGSMGEFVEKAYEIHNIMETDKSQGGGWDYCVYKPGDGDTHKYGHSCGLASTIEEAVAGQHNTCCATYVSWCLKQVGYTDFKNMHGAKSTYDWTVEQGFTPILSYEEMQPGDLLFNKHDYTGSDVSQIGHVQILGNNKEWLNAGSVEAINDSPKSYTAKFIIGMRPNLSGAGKVFEGYEPGQLVVSPASGEVIEAGLTTRKNQETNEDEEVGFIKIRTLEHGHDKNNNNTKETSDLVNLGLSRNNKGDIAGNDEIKGYGYFFNEYENVASGYTFYIDGFDPALFVELEGEGEDAVSVFKEYKQQLTTEEGTVVAIFEDGKPISKYEKKDSQLSYAASVVSLKEKLEKEEEAKDLAVPFIQDANGKIYIKEGTVIGITKTNKEYESEEEIPEEKKEDVKVGDVKEGNYIRAVLRDKEEDAVVENVEEYMEIEDDDSTNISDDILMKYLWAHENAAAMNYLMGNSTYDSYTAQYITEDKKYFICYGDSGDADLNRNFGPGIMHRTKGGTLHNVEHYATQGINNLGNYCENGVSQMRVDIVLNIQELIVEAKREDVIKLIGESRFNKLTKQQQDCLTDIAYQRMGLS